MTKEKKEINKRIKYYHIILLSILLCPLLMINSNYKVKKRTEEKLNQNANEKFERILYGRKLEDFEEGTKKICEKGSEELKEYYLTGDKEKIELKDDEDKDEENPEYINALIDIIKQGTGKETEKDINDNAMTYGKHLMGPLIFLVIAFLSLIAWPVCCSCACCNCCCCCCCKNPCCKLPFFIITYVCYALVVAVCIYGLSKSNIIFVGLSDTECSFLKFFNETIEGESKSDLPKWAGISGINRLLGNVKTKIDSTGSSTLTTLENEDNTIKSKQRSFEEKLDENSKAVTKKDENKEEMKDHSGVNKNFRLDISSRKLYGVFDYNTKTIDPSNSFIDIWYKEYSTLARESNGFISRAKSDFSTILGSGELTNQLGEGQKQIDEIGGPINDLKESISDIIIENSDTINDYGKLGFKIIFSVLTIVDIALAAVMLLLCLFSGKLCNKCCCCRCAFKFLIHLLWNILALLMFLSILIGSIFTIIGNLGKDFILVINYFVSEKNLNGAEEPLIIGEEGRKLNACFNGDGKILDKLGFNLTEMDSFDSLNDIIGNLTTAEENFTQLYNQDGTYGIMTEELRKRTEYTITDFYVFLDDDLNTPGDAYKLSDLLNDLNRDDTVAASREKWSVSCDSENLGTDWTCKDIKNEDMSSSYLPAGYSSDAKEIGSKIQSIKTLVTNANTGTTGFKILSAELNTLYKGFLNSEIQALREFKSKILDLKSIFVEYIGEKGSFFDFVNCKFLGTNLKVILKYLKNSIGENIYTVGICLILSGCSMAIAIIFTILLIVIINTNVDANKKS